MIDEILKRLAEKVDMDDDLESIIEDLRGYAAKIEGERADWEQRHNRIKERYINRFFTSPDEIKEDTREDVEKDGEILEFDDLFEDREGDYKHGN